MSKFAPKDRKKKELKRACNSNVSLIGLFKYGTRCIKIWSCYVLIHLPITLNYNQDGDLTYGTVRKLLVGLLRKLLIKRRSFPFMPGWINKQLSYELTLPKRFTLTALVLFSHFDWNKKNTFVIQNQLASRIVDIFNSISLTHTHSRKSK